MPSTWCLAATRNPFKDQTAFYNLPAGKAGIPSQLLQNRPDIRQAELELAASKLDVAVASQFYPSVQHFRFADWWDQTHLPC